MDHKLRWYSEEACKKISGAWRDICSVGTSLSHLRNGQPMSNDFIITDNNPPAQGLVHTPQREPQPASPHSLSNIRSAGIGASLTDTLITDTHFTPTRFPTVLPQVGSSPLPEGITSSNTHFDLTSPGSSIEAAASHNTSSGSVFSEFERHQESTSPLTPYSPKPPDLNCPCCDALFSTVTALV